MTGGQKAFWFAFIPICNISSVVFRFQSSYFTKISPEYHLNAVGNTDSSLETVSVFAKDVSCCSPLDVCNYLAFNEILLFCSLTFFSFVGPSSSRLIYDFRDSFTCKSADLCAGRWWSMDSNGRGTALATRGIKEIRKIKVY